MGDLEKKNYYERLGLARNATEQEIRDAYTGIAKIYHPDSHFYDDLLDDAQLASISETSPETDEVFNLVNEAYNTLINSEKRTAYDRTLPSETKNWNDQIDIAKEAELAHREMRIIKEKPKSWGTFGNVDDLVEIVIEQKNSKASTPKVAPESDTNIKSVAEMIQDQRQKQQTENKSVVVVPKWISIVAVAVGLVVIVLIALYFIRGIK
jgi:DnaJ-class molecular chaperone